MPNQLMQPDLLERYLRILGIQKTAPDFDSLAKLVEAHQYRIPFENISKLYYKKYRGLHGIPDLELYLDGIERYNFGGTCYSNNYYFYQLLTAVGYQVVLCGADMSEPDVHMVSIVTLEKREYLIDVGYAAPFRLPLPRDLATDYVITQGSDCYILKPQDAQGCSRMELFRDGNLKHGYLAKPIPKQIPDFEPAIHASFRETATFMNTILLTRFFFDRFLVIHNLTVTESKGTATSLLTLTGREDLAQVIFEYFEIPSEIAIDVVNNLGQFEDAWN